MADILHQAQFHKSSADPYDLGRCSGEVAFVGRSNVGKSSLLNALCRQKNLARTSKTPGRTRTINVFCTPKHTWVVDLPGYGFAVGSEKEKQTWQYMIEGYLTGRESLRCVYVLIDAKVGPTKLDHQMIDWLRFQGVPLRVVANKADQVKVPEQESRRKEVAESLGFTADSIAWVSAAKGTGIAELRAEVERTLCGG